MAEQGLGLYPEDLYFGLYYQIGLSAQGRPEEALTATRKYLTRHPQEPNAWDELGIRFLNLALKLLSPLAPREIRSRWIREWKGEASHWPGPMPN